MSYILDALRKAEADRKLGEAVGVHDPAPQPSPFTPPPALAWPKWWLLVMVGCLILATAWLWLISGNRSVDADKASTAPTELPSGNAYANTTSTPSPSEANAALAEAVQIPQPALRKPTPAPNAPANSDLTVNTNQPAPTTASAATATTTPPTPSPAETAIRLTPELRATLPPMSVGGAMYAEVPSNRMVVINGQLFREGDAISPDLTLETIRLKSAVIRYRGQRYVLDY
jgi:general secretion pathway protein B